MALSFVCLDLIRLIRVGHASYKPPKEVETEEEEIGEASKNLAQQYQDTVDYELKRDFANVEPEDEIAKYKDADKIRYNPRNDPINNSTFNSVRNRNEEAQVEKDKGNDNDQIEDEEEDEFEDPMAKF
ncbi:hypothetical protein B5S30_g5676 [[Candida] boidinii]|nr:hypothetical protein B5S30_g5676 [[Candida] boidinii]